MTDSALDLLQEGDRARREGRLVDAHHHFSNAIAACRQDSRRSELIRALTGLGQIERDLDRADAARPLMEEAVALCRADNNALVLAHTVRHLGDILYDDGSLEQAERSYQEALDLYRGDPHTAPLDLANAMRPLAILKGRLGQTAQARSLWIEARDLYLAINVPDGAAECTYRMARLQDE